MKTKHILITGSAGLVGSEAVRFYSQKGYVVHGIDNNMRKYFFGSDGDTSGVRESLVSSHKKYHHHDFDIRDELALQDLFKSVRFDLIIHAAGQPSHDWSATDPIGDFAINATATLSLLENARKYSPDAVYIFTSTNKVYGDSPNALPFVELPTRYDLPTTHPSYDGINESMTIDKTTHTVFGVSKTAADLMVQEYGRYFGLRTGVFRCGCLTGPAHRGARQHGFLSFLVRSAKENRPYTVYGYKGKQVRDNLHVSNLVAAFDAFYEKPRPGEVYNMGGSRASNISLIEAIAMIERLGKTTIDITFVDTPRIGDHQWYVSDVKKFQRHYPQWRLTHTTEKIIEELWSA
ncbi:MAG: NAD-dependent epimerase/dehydratase family protein [Candidatus Gottesmanbacteria bacterium]|nr:NAD-dependent epimerase/dehydratase family protein [Candidatus Gottesmanbacteria bacterium]